ncbi:curli production assembly/transport component CsgF [Rhizobium sp. 2MFCol3.1]|uniref:curli production assembly/transport component CsgF n=1 Tax=Rhizobium sp. 2MFCol3.1 TaxID=1246459 RepID=UPI0003654472|nr:curli production assembly/transport component CsgF [Rhizobium sp. 2MFCol3.1]
MAQRLRSVLGGLAVLLSACAAQAGSLVYTPVNPAFGGSPLNGNWMMSQADAQNQHKDSGKSAISGPSALTPGQMFANQLTSQLYASLANQITESLFGANAQTSGSYTLAGTTISFVRVGGEIQISINDGSTITNVTVPATP